MQTVLLVEGASDRIAIETLARRRNQDLTETLVVSLDGVTNASKAIAEFGPRGQDVRMAGLCDVGEERYIRGGLERAGLGPILTRDDMERLGFFVCVTDLEDELIRSLGTPAVTDVLAQEGDLQGFRVFQNQPFQRGRTAEQQLHRFFGTTSGRKAQYARALVERLELRQVPRPLVSLLDFVAQAT